MQIGGVGGGHLLNILETRISVILSRLMTTGWLTYVLHILMHIFVTE